MNKNSGNNNQIQQGDVLLFSREASLPVGSKRRNSRTIALGEATGHHHTFEEGVAIYDAPDGRVLVINESDEAKNLTHQEHKPIFSDPGMIYEFGLVREKDWFRDMVSSVQD